MELHVVGRTDVGRVRAQNEDSYLASLPLVAVADGMGGHNAGEVASRLALDVLRERLDGDPDPSRLREAVREANRLIYSRGSSDRSLEGMGTTLTAAWLSGSIVTLAHVGDSRAYLLRGGTLQQLTEDQTLVQQWENEGKLEPGEGERSRYRHILTQALGGERDVAVDPFTLELQPGDRLLLSSDGLHGTLTHEQLGAILTSTADPELACRTLISEANAAGGEDNITVVIVDAHEPGSQPASEPQPIIVSKPVTGRGPAERRRRRRRTWVLLAAACGLLVVVAAAFLRSASTTYMVGERDGQVAILRGRPGAVREAELIRKEPVAVASLPSRIQARVREGIPVASEVDAQRTIDNLVVVKGPTETPSPTPAETPTPFPE